MIFMPSRVAFSSLAGPMFAPARRYCVAPDTDATLRPPYCSMSALYSSREWCSNVPLITTEAPLRMFCVGADCGFSSTFICTPYCASRSMSSRLSMSFIYSTTLRAMRSPISGMAVSCSMVASRSWSIDFIAEANRLATVSPT